jgi:hypothetical protein
MSTRILLSAFSSEDDVMGAVRAAREHGLKILDLYAPYAVHGLDEALGLRRSRLPWVCFWAAVIGAFLKLWFEFWTMAVSWPVNVGGKPWNSLPAFVPVTFEVMVLSAGISTVVAFFIVERLRPGKPAHVPMAGVTDDRFVLAIEQSDAAFDLRRVERLFRDYNAVVLEERLEED